MNKMNASNAVQRFGRRYDEIFAVPPVGLSIKRWIYLEDGTTLAMNGFASTAQMKPGSRDFTLIDGEAREHSMNLGDTSSFDGASLYLSASGESAAQEGYFLKRTWSGGAFGPPLETDPEFHERVSTRLESTHGFLVEFARSILDFRAAGGPLAEQPVPTKIRGEIQILTRLSGGFDLGVSGGGRRRLDIEVRDVVTSFEYARYRRAEPLWRSLPPNMDGEKNGTESNFADYRAYAAQDPGVFAWLNAHPDFEPWTRFCREWGYDAFTPPSDPRFFASM